MRLKSSSHFHFVKINIVVIFRAKLVGGVCIAFGNFTQ